MFECYFSEEEKKSGKNAASLINPQTITHWF